MYLLLTLIFSKIIRYKEERKNHAQIHVNITCFYLFRCYIETHFVNIWTYQIQYTFGESAVHRTENDSLKTKVSLGNQKKTSNKINVIEHGELLPFLT